MHFGSIPYKTKQFFFVLIKLSIVVGAFYFIYQKLVQNESLNFHDFTAFLSKNDSFSLKNIVFLLFLTIFNWFFEIIKWKTLVKTIQPISFKNALEQSLGSLTASLITPNRIGEYGAKAVYYLKNRKRIMFLNLLGNVMQMSATIVFGCIGLYFLITTFNLEVNYIKVTKIIVVVAIITLFAGFGLSQNKFKNKGFELTKIKQFYSQISLQTKLLGFLFSVLRYLIFSFQFYFLLLMFGVNVHYTNAMVIITSMYLLASLIPSIFIFDVIIKGSVAVYLFTLIGIDELTVLSVVTMMWLLNFVLPSLFGSYYVLNFNLPKETA